MALTLNTNVASLSTQQYLNVNSTSANQSLQQLSSGNRLNGPADDPAGYAIAYKLGVKSASLSTAINNGNQALSMLQVAQGGIQQIGNILTQLKQIATEAASSNTDASTLPALNTQVTQLFTEINNIASATQYGGTGVLQGSNVFTQTLAETAAGIDNVNVSGAVGSSVLYTLTMTGNAGSTSYTMWNGTTTQTIAAQANPNPGLTSTINFTSFGISMNVNAAVTTLAATGLSITTGASSFSYQVGSENQGYNQIGVNISNFQYTFAGGLNLGAGTDNVSSQANAKLFMTDIDAAATWLTGQAGSIGAAQNEITYQVSNLQNMNTNTQSAASTIKDTDYAASMSNFTKAQVATQAGVAMLAQANQIPQQILTLIKG